MLTWVYNLRVSRVSNIGCFHRILGLHASCSQASCAMPARRLEDRIRELCARALYERDPQWSATLIQLQLAIQEHSLRVANACTGSIVTGKPLIIERRQA